MNTTLSTMMCNNSSVNTTIIKKRKIIIKSDESDNLSTVPVSKTTVPVSKTVSHINQTTESLIDMIQRETYSEVVKQESMDKNSVLEHLGKYIEEPYTLIESYFSGQHLERLVRHQTESYNHFINNQIHRTIQMFNPVKIHSENDYVLEHNLYFLEVNIIFENFKIYPPQIHENNGATKLMFPQETKLRNFTYASTMTIDIRIEYTVRNTESMDTPKIITIFIF